jgi:hypothetical protein
MPDPVQALAFAHQGAAYGVGSAIARNDVRLLAAGTRVEATDGAAGSREAEAQSFSGKPTARSPI